MTTGARIGYGTLFALLSSGSYVTIAEVTSVTPPGFSRDAQDATHTESPDAFREFIAGLTDAGEVGIELNFDPGSSSAALLLAQFDTQDPGTHKITFPDGSTWVFTGILTGFEPQAPVDEKMVATATFKVSGKPVLTQA